MTINYVEINLAFVFFFLTRSRIYFIVLIYLNLKQLNRDVILKKNNFLQLNSNCVDRTNLFCLFDYF